MTTRHATGDAKPAPIGVVVVGAGQRGHHVYGRWLGENRDRARTVAVVEPDPERRRLFAAAHGLGPDRCFAAMEELAARATPPGEACIVATPDRAHVEPAQAALAMGYEVLVEKPLAHDLTSAVRLVAAAQSAGRSLHVAHVLRHAPLFATLHDVVTSGEIGDVVSVSHRENLWAFHMAHSFVRGNWSRAASATPMIVQKTCHDFDVLAWNLPSPVARLSSFGSLTHFRPENAPPGATDRCTDGCPVPDCPFDARRVYLDPAVTGWPVEAVTSDLSPAGRRRALDTGPYGRCVYRAGSDVVDHQTVAMELENSATVTLTMQGHSDREERTMRYDGTRGTVRATTARGGVIEVARHHDGARRAVPIPTAGSGHGGGDGGLVEAFIRSVRDGTPALTEASGALESHLLAFLAEESRLTGQVIDVAARRSTLTTG